MSAPTNTVNSEHATVAASALPDAATTSTETVRPENHDDDDETPATNAKPLTDEEKAAKADKARRKKERAKRKKLEKQQANGAQQQSGASDSASSSSTSGAPALDLEGSAAEMDKLEAEFPSNPMHAYFTEKNGMKLVFNRAKGRHVIAARPIPAGESVFRIPAYAAVVNDAFVHAFCSRCFQTAPTMLCCSKCQHARFCSVKCKNAMANVHNLECGALQRLQEVNTETETAPFRMLIRICYLHQQEKLGKAAATADGKGAKGVPSSSSCSTPAAAKPVWRPQAGQSWADAQSLITHLAQHPTESKSAILVTIVNLQQRVIQDESMWADAELTPQVLLEVLLQIQCNAHTIADSMKNHVGVGLFIPAAYLNHSCRPTCVFWFDEQGEMVMQAIRPITKGEEITYSYVNLYTSRAERALLLQRHFFIPACQCSRCQKTSEKASEDALMKSMICSACSNNPLVQWKHTNETGTQPEVNTPPSILKYNKSGTGDQYCPNGSCNKNYSKSTIDELISNVSRLATQADLIAQSGDVEEAIEAYEERILYVNKPLVSGHPFFHPHHSTMFNIYLRMIRLLESAPASTQKLLEWRMRYAAAAQECLDAQHLSQHPEAAGVLLDKARALRELYRIDQRCGEDEPHLFVHPVPKLIPSNDASASSSSSSSGALHLLSAAYNDFAQAKQIHTICYGRTHPSTKKLAAEADQLQADYERWAKKNGAQASATDSAPPATKGNKKK